MNRLQSEWRRLYAPAGAGRPDGLDAVLQADPLDASALVDGQGRVRALVLQLARPADWSALSRVWQGVQLDLGWPAPAIAVSGSDGHQLWFSLQQGVSAAQGHAVLRGLQARYLGDIASARVDLWPVHEATAPHGVRHARPIPAEPERPEQWSAFVAPDLAPVFNDTPWLDLPPNLEGQADLLARLLSISPAEWAAAQAPLGVTTAALQTTPTAAPPANGAPATPAATGHSPTGSQTDPHRFLLDVMNNAAIDMGLRIEAAKALLPYVRPN
ncbi:MAG: hypothetical protein RBT42_05860 [Aquabacterium sp.]|jgi:hypothetical protein|uniref:hypothetical protein n=1 Tax=Aquabacterium sp. TaxID=1872578 RepID=UPI002A359729|nr:hypothetical protein [Aquabacterium sp.]MDX9843265.1 hypothetical protein [Aquabacterium sp.]